MNDPTAGDWAAVAGDEECARIDLADAEHEIAGFLHPLIWGNTIHDTEPGDGSDCHECYSMAERLIDEIAPQFAPPLPDSPAPSLRRWIVFVGIGLALAGVWLVWRMWS